MTKRNIYPRPPIVEAVVEFEFASAVVADGLLERLRSSLPSTYSGKRTQTRIDASIAISGDEVSTSSRRTPVAFIESEDGLRLVGLNSTALSVHVLAPYPGWERFRELVDELVGALPSEVSAQPLRTLKVRYIDHVALPADSRPGSYFPALEQAGSMPQHLTTAQIVTQSRDGLGTTARLLIGLSNQEVLYDLLLQREHPHSLDSGGWQQVIEELHSRQREIFEESITEKARELFR